MSTDVRHIMDRHSPEDRLLIYSESVQAEIDAAIEDGDLEWAAAVKAARDAARGEN